MSTPVPFKYVPAPKNALDNDKTHLFTPSTQQGKQARLHIQFIDNNPRIRVFTNDQTDKTKENDNGAIYAKMDIIAFNRLMDLFEIIETVPEGKHYRIENKNFIFPYGKRSETPVVVSETYVGRDKDGVVWISVIAKDRPKLRFFFKGSSYHNFNHPDGTPVSLVESSITEAKIWAKTIKGIVGIMVNNNYIDVDARKAEREASEAAASRDANTNSGGNANDGTTFDDDLPF